MNDSHPKRRGLDILLAVVAFLLIVGLCSMTYVAPMLCGEYQIVCGFPDDPRFEYVLKALPVVFCLVVFLTRKRNPHEKA